MKERPILFSAPMVRALLAGTKTQTRRVVKPCKDRETNCALAQNEIAGEINAGVYSNSKYGAPGDRLWVRETFHAESKSTIHYRADGWEYGAAGGWKPSIFMPRWASRLTLEITGVRVEKLQDISGSDAEAEGVAQTEMPSKPRSVWRRQQYRELWEQINGPGSWEANPWVWVLEFKNMPNAKLTGRPRDDHEQ